MAGNYRQRISASVERLRATPGFSISVYEIAPPVSDEEISSVLAEVYGYLPAGTEEFYRELNGFDLEWEYASPGSAGEPTDRGSIRFCTLAEVFAEGLGDTWFDDFEGGDRFRNVKPFDLFVEEECAAFLQEPGEIPQDGVYFHYFGEETSPLNLTFSQYLEGTLASCGYLDWRMALTPDNPRMPGGRAVLERMQEIIPGFEGLPEPGS